jgi:hypothetical protein
LSCLVTLLDIQWSGFDPMGGGVHFNSYLSAVGEAMIGWGR